MGNSIASRQIVTRSALTLALLLSLTGAGCKKKVAATPPPPPPAPTKTEAPPAAKPTISSFEAEPRTIERGQSATLRWSVSGEATEISIAPGVGTVSASGSRQVFPGQTTTYTLTASGPGGSTTLTANVTVTAPEAAPAPPPAAPKRGPSEIISDIRDALFDYDSSAIREDARSILTKNADALKGLFSDFPSVAVTVEGHADERGSAEYNLGLADRRAAVVRDFLVQLGVPGDRLRPTSFGKERPQCTESNESCWQLNRRAHFSLGQ